MGQRVERVLTLTISVTGGTWTADFDPTHYPYSCSSSYATHYGDTWKRYLADGSWQPVEGAVVIDYSQTDYPVKNARVPGTDARIERGMVDRFGTGPAWGCPQVIEAIDWDAEDFGCGVLDVVHPLDQAEMLRRVGVHVVPLMEYAQG